MPTIHFLDVTNRDGVQTARTGLSKFGKTMINFYLGKLGVAQSELGFPFLFHEVPYIRANVALAEAGAFGPLRLSGWCRAVPGDVEAAVPLGLRHYNLSISTSDQMIEHKFRGRLDRAAVITEMTAAVRAAVDAGAETIGVNAEDGSRTDDGFLLEFATAAREAGAHRVRYCDTIGGDTPYRIRERFAKLASQAGLPVETHCHNDRRAGGAPGEHSVGVNAEDGSRTDDGYLLEFALAAREAGASRVRYCDTIGGDSPGRIRERFAKLASAIGIPVETHCHNDLGMAVANSVSGALGDLDAGQDAWINTCVNGIGERAGNADLLSCSRRDQPGRGADRADGPVQVR